MMQHALRAAGAACCSSRLAPSSCSPLAAAPRPARTPLRACGLSRRVQCAASSSEDAAPSSTRAQLVAATKRIRDLGAQGDAQGAVAVLAELGGSGVTPDLRAVTATLNACISAGELPRAQRVFEELVDAGVVVPDELLFTVLLRAHGAKSPVPWGDVSALLGTMKHTWGISPSTLTYNVLLEVCAATNDYDRGCQLIDRLLEEGVQPDAFTLAAVASRKSLRSYLKRGL